MSCEEYREALSGAAASAERELSRELRVHLDVCRECSAAFQEEQKLFAAIDSGVQKIANAEVPVSLLPRVWASLERGGAPRRSFLPYFVFASAAICAVLVAVGIQNWRRTAVIPQAVHVAGRATLAEKPSEQVIAHALKHELHPVKRRSNGKYLAARAGQPQFTVLLPAGQKQTVDELLSELRSGTIKANEVIVEKAETPSSDLEVSPLSITPIEVKPLATIVEDAAPASGKTKS